MLANNKEFVVDAIKGGLRAFCEMSYFKAYNGSWYTKLNRSNQLQVGRAIFTLRNIALNPDTHFLHGADSADDALGAAFWEDYKMRARFNNFYGEVKEWYTNASATNANKIVAMSNKIKDDYVIASEGRLVLYMKKLVDNSTVRRFLLGTAQNER